MEHSLNRLWLDLRDRMAESVTVPHASLSIRIPGGTNMWLGSFTDQGPDLFDWSQENLAQDTRDVHASIYRARPDVGSILLGGSTFGARLVDFRGRIPLLFDEQARHLGWMGEPADNEAQVQNSLKGGGNCLMIRRMPVCLGSTPTRMAMNAELFEKCAKAYVLASATGHRLTTLPWVVCYVATRRLKKDQKAARQAFAAGRMPVETKGY